MQKYSLPPDFELSQSYLFFFDKVERANYVSGRARGGTGSLPLPALAANLARATSVRPPFPPPYAVPAADHRHSI